MTPPRTITLPLSQDAQEALRAEGLTEIPRGVTLTLREASVREREWFEAGQADGGPAKTDPLGWVAGLLARRAPTGTDPRVLREIVRDMAPSDMAQHVTAYLNGVMPDPNLTRRVVSRTLTGITDQLLGAFVTASTPSSEPPTTSPTPS